MSEQWNQKNQGWIIVTGAAGFIGSNVVHHLNQQGFTDIIAVDELGTSESWKNLVGMQFSLFLEKDQLFDWLEGRESEIAAIIHLGACSSTVEKNASFLLQNNTQYTQALAEYALTHQIRFIYASSAATYGDGSRGFSDDHETLEDLRPLNMYGYSKHLFDLWAKQQGVLDEIVGLKYFNVFGPNEAHKGRMASAVLHFTSQALNEGQVRLFQSSEPEKFGDGDQCRDFIYVRDAVKMTCGFLSNDHGGIFNIGTGEPNTWNTLAEGVFEGLEREMQIEYIPMPEDLRGKYQNYTCAEMGKLESCMTYSTQGFKESVVDYVRNYLVKDGALVCQTVTEVCPLEVFTRVRG